MSGQFLTSGAVLTSIPFFLFFPSCFSRGKKRRRRLLVFFFKKTSTDRSFSRFLLFLMVTHLRCVCDEKQVAAAAAGPARHSMRSRWDAAKTFQKFIPLCWPQLSQSVGVYGCSAHFYFFHNDDFYFSFFFLFQLYWILRERKNKFW